MLQELTKKLDIEFKDNKKNINIILRGSYKYYYANQCKQFENNLKKYGC